MMKHLDPKIAWTIFVLFLVVVFGLVGYYSFVYYQEISKDTSPAVSLTTSATPTATSSASPTSTVVTTPTPTTSSTDETANWQTYTNSTYEYSIKYPTQWTAGPGSSPTSLGIYLSNGGQTQMQIITVATTKYANESLTSFATDYVTPKDKSTITGKMSFDIGSNEGIKELVTVSDPASNGLWYFTKNSNYYMVFITSETSVSPTTNEILSTFKFSD